ncbi:hypothetical protein HanXRQr2_Chr13g0615161 [Helianthus annuus]|uniref:Uncharacterized protein n=1 Tax=Helianthus annuus TaxID=4232 RepID=A0A9K3ELW5_HELAN|nr:hypothetical protein HanXRQr2_Chr13g0615161 [Helianthus annuus]
MAKPPIWRRQWLCGGGGMRAVAMVVWGSEYNTPRWRAITATAAGPVGPVTGLNAFYKF